ncbi:MAG: hypothetical protein ACEPOV_14470 [Hyphomicrobiales bacterium]
MSKKQKETKKKNKGRKHLKYIIPILFIPIIILLLVKTFDEKLHMGGDNAHYYILAKSIKQDFSYKEIQRPDAPPAKHFPPGYPLFLSIALFFGKYAFIVGKVLNGVLLIISFLIFYLLMDEVLSKNYLKVLASVFFVFNANLYYYSTYMMSEILFMLTTLLTLLLIAKSKHLVNRKYWIYFALIILLSIYTWYIRTIGTSLIIAIVIYYLIQKKWKESLIYTGSIVLGLLPWIIRNKNLGGNSYMNQLMKVNPLSPEDGIMGLSDWGIRIWENFVRYISYEMYALFFPYIRYINYKVNAPIWMYILGGILFVLMIIGMIKLKKYGWLIFFYLGATIGILLLWPSIWKGVRFIVPLYPVLLLLSIKGLHSVFIFGASMFKKENYQKRVVLIGMLLTLIIVPNMINGIKGLQSIVRSELKPSYQNYFRMAAYCNQKLPKDAVICCRKPNLFYLMSNRKVTNFKNTSDKNEFMNLLVDRNVRYVVVDQLGYSNVGKYLVPFIQENKYLFRPINKLPKPDTYLLEFKSPK